MNLKQFLSATIASNSDRPTYARIWNTRIGIYENQTYSYDASGYLTQISSELTDTSKNYVIGLGWNSLGQLSTMTNTNPATTMPNDPTALHGASSATYYYDAFGARIKKVTKDTAGQLLMSTGFMYSDVDPYKVLSEYTLNYDAMRTPAGYGNMSSKEYIYLPMPEDQNTWVPVALMRQTTYTGFDVHYLHVDQLGTVQSIVQAKAASSPSVAGGNVMMASYPGVLGDNRLYVKWDFIQNGPFNLRAPGQYFDPETGLLYNNARYFNPRIGAFISGDPIGRDGGANVYAYGVGSLVNDVDESGLQAIVPGPFPLPIPLPPVVIPGSPANKEFVRAINNIILSQQQSCSDTGSSIKKPPISDEQKRKRGNCSPFDHDRLQQAVDTACKSRPFSCKGDQDNLKLLFNRHLTEQCINARQEINKICFNGGDDGHNASIDQLQNNVDRCNKFLSY